MSHIVFVVATQCCHHSKKTTVNMLYVNDCAWLHSSKTLFINSRQWAGWPLDHNLPIPVIEHGIATVNVKGKK